MAEDNPGYVYAYGWNRLNSRIVGIWPESHQSFFMKYCAFFYAFAILLLVWLPMTASLYFQHDKFDEFMVSLIICILVFMSMYKLILFRLRRRVLNRYLISMAKDWSMDRTEEEMKVMVKKAKYSRIISMISVIVVSGMFISFSCVGAFAAISERQFMTNDSRLAVGFLYSSYFPYDTSKFGLYAVTWFGQWCSTLVSMVAYVEPDTFIAMMIFHLCGQLATVRIALKNIVDEKCLKDSNLFWKRLSSIIQRHEELNCRVELIEESFNLLLLIEIIQRTITFCFQTYVTLTAFIDGLTGVRDFPFLQIIFLIIQITCGVLHMFLYCWSGDLLDDESKALSFAPYEGDWFLLNPVQIRALMMVTHRTRIPLQITAGKFAALSFELFSSIIKTSMGYLSVLLAVKET